MAHVTRFWHSLIGFDPTYAESTTIALLARLAGLLEPLREFTKTKPVWGTCAGAILLAQNVENTKKGGQEVLGAMSISITRNGWGSQVCLTYHVAASTYIQCRKNLSRQLWKLTVCVSRIVRSTVSSYVLQ